jgi:hypothetical protein
LNYRFHDLAKEDEEDGPRASTFIGGTNLVDLWLCEVRGGTQPRDDLYVLICQYEYDMEYVSYTPPSAVLDHAKGKGVNVNGTDFHGQCVTTYPPDTRVHWSSGKPPHDPIEVAKYLATFYPDIFTEDERIEALGLTLTTMEQ